MSWGHGEKRERKKKKHSTSPTAWPGGGRPDNGRFLNSLLRDE